MNPPPQLRRVLNCLDQVRDKLEVVNAETTRRYIVSLPEDEPVTEELICELHRLLTQGMDYYGNVPGEYRGEGVMDMWGPVSGTYVAPDHQEVPGMMKGLVDWLQRRETSMWNQSVQAVWAHFKLLTIHPFADGNGRVARALEALLLYRAGINRVGFWALANYYYQNREDYVWHLDKARHTGKVAGFLEFGLNGLARELHRIHGQLLLWDQKYDGQAAPLGDDAVREALADLGYKQEALS